MNYKTHYFKRIRTIYLGGKPIYSKGIVSMRIVGSGAHVFYAMPVGDKPTDGVEWQNWIHDQGAHIVTIPRDEAHRLGEWLVKASDPEGAYGIK